MSIKDIVYRNLDKLNIEPEDRVSYLLSSLIKGVFITFVFTGAVFSWTFFLAVKNPSDGLKRHFENKIAVIDVNRLLTEFAKENQAKDLSKQEVNKLADEFGDNLIEYINSKAAKEHITILPKQVVLSGAKDITDTAKHDLFGVPANE